MLLIILKYYNFYIILTPFLIFWFIFIQFLLCVFVYRFFNFDRVIYFPILSEWSFVNFTVVLPKRMAFNIIYYSNTSKYLSFKNLKNFIFIMSVVFFIGLPFIYIKCIYLYYIHRDVYIVLRLLSKYQNLKLVIINGVISRNMKKKVTDNLIYEAEKANKLIAERGWQGLYKIEKGTHAVAFDKQTCFGVTYTSKIQKNVEFGSKIDRGIKSYVYVQKFDIDNDYNISKDLMRDNVLKEMLDSDGIVLTAIAHKRILEQDIKNIIVNKNNSQAIERISRIDILNTEKFIDGCEGFNSLLEYNNIQQEMINEFKQIITDLNNSKSVEERMIIKEKYRNTLENLKMFKQSYINLRNDEIDQILLKINSIIDA